MQEKSKDGMLCCAHCGNLHVEVQAWVDINTNEHISDVDSDDYWCPQCEEMVSICTVAEYEKRNNQ